MESLLGYILLENSAIQLLDAKGGPDELTAAHERVTKLVWKLKQIDPRNPTFIKAWNMLVDYGEKDLRAMLLYQATAAIREYSHAFSRLKVKINSAVSLLSIKEQVEPALSELTSVATSLWQERRVK
ncbi:hypothetical protein [Spirosoma pollinicola]|uniref:Uncharacterized protein n=1 Tax=Spirosoma pollinicola TaxID=2057025 RepID=A0A2K8YYV4_9BACT|nr:hypothetical protein [Spirosoma pollinicola]AUD02769.1 hypothetical protein CWM47_13565 [Spirosoma pollinicola]